MQPISSAVAGLAARLAERQRGLEMGQRFAVGVEGTCVLASPAVKRGRFRFQPGALVMLGDETGERFPVAHAGVLPDCFRRAPVQEALPGKAQPFVDEAAQLFMGEVVDDVARLAALLDQCPFQERFQGNDRFFFAAPAGCAHGIKLEAPADDGSRLQ